MRLQDDGSRVELSVTDDGPGIDPAFLPYVFDRFRQADSSSTRQHAGVGLGLAIVRHLVELHGGTVEARNREDRPGAVLIVRLPRQHAVLGRAGPAAERVRQRRGVRPAPSLQDVSVLVVDDEDDTREAMAIGLGRHGARVATASSAREALERPGAGAPPGSRDRHRHGRRGRLRAPSEGSGAPGRARGRDPGHRPHGIRQPAGPSADALRAGFQMHLSKPATPADLAAAVASLVALAQPATSSR